MKAVASILGIFVTASPLSGQAQDAPAPPPPASSRPDNPNHDHPRGSHGGFGGPGSPGMMSHGDRERFEMFKDMPEEQKKKVRAAFEKVWKKPEVTEARDRLMKSNEEYRKILHEALAEADPEVVKILESNKRPMGPGGSSMLGKMPEPGDPDFANKVIQRLKAESQSGERRESAFPRMHEKIMQMPAVAEAVKTLQQAEPGKRMEAWTRLREVYQATAKTELGKMRENFRREGASGNPRHENEGAVPSE